MKLRNAIKQSCDTYFYEVARRLGVDRLNLTAIKYGLGNRTMEDIFLDEKKGLVPSTKWKKNNLGKGWVLGETLITGIGQGYIQTTPLQLCLMTAQLANGGFKIYPKINSNDSKDSLEIIKSKNILNALKHAYDCLGSTLSIFGMDGENPFTEKVFEHDYIHIDNYNYGVIELSSEIILHGIVESLVVE